MGFRCPNCKEDFGINKEEFNKHLEENEECLKVAGITLSERFLKETKTVMEVTKEEKIEACESFIWCIDTNDISMRRVECHEKLEELWNTGKDNEKLRNILHNLDLTIGYPLTIRGLNKYLFKKYSKKLYNLLESVKDWTPTDDDLDKALSRKRGKTSGAIMFND